MLRHGQRRERHPETRSGRLVHLAEHENCFREDGGGRTIRLLNHRILHLVPEVVTLTGTLAHSGETRVAAVLGGDVVDQFLDQNGLTQSRAAEEAGLTTLGIGSEQVDNLDAGLENLCPRAQLVKLRRLGMDRTALLRLERLPLVDRVAQQVEYPAQGLIPDRHRDGRSGIDNICVSHQAIGGAHGHGTDPVASEVLLDLADQLDRFTISLEVDLESVEDIREMVSRELGIDGRPDDLDDLSCNCL